MVITETDLQFMKISFIMVIIKKKKFENFLKSLNSH